jgi:lon-related putative ATP-dependent protease
MGRPSVAELKPLPAEALRRRCDATRFPFETTAALADIPLGLGQDRAEEAMRFGIGIHRYGYNLYALGPPGMGKQGFVRSLLEQDAAQAEPPSDWCYVANFAEPHRPRALRLPAGQAQPFRRDVERLIEELKVAIPAAFEGDDYRNRRRLLESRIGERSEKAFVEIEKRAHERKIALVRTPVGIALAPTRDNGEVMEAEDFQKLPEDEKKRYSAEMAELQDSIQKAVADLPRDARRHRQSLRELDRTVSSLAVAHLIDELRPRYAAFAQVLAYLDDLQRDVLDNVSDFSAEPQESTEGLNALLAGRGRGRKSFRRYAVNVLVDHSGAKGAPVVYEDHPSLANLVGRVEHLSELGSLVTDFTLIKPGALHRANGGALVLDARKLLLQPYAWEELKRALRSRQLRIESLGQSLGLVSTISLEPEPIPLDVKLVLLGDRPLYYLLAELDPEFAELFKVAADFEEATLRDDAAEDRYARLLGTLARRDGLRPLERGAVARLVEEGSRLAADNQRLSLRLESLSNLLCEADHLAAADGVAAVSAEHVRRALLAQVRRADRLQERLQEEILRGTFLIDTERAKVGQVNALTVLQLGGYAFGRPSRVTARVRLGSGQLVDIEREVELGGPIHSKGVLILGGFLGERYSAERPLSLHASLVFEQSYGGVEGDSASCAELVALLSALAEVPVRQSLALTGSVNQRGEVQAVGGVNEKIEGFFDICKARGLTGEQGVLIPAANVKHLMLKDELLEEVSRGRFHVYAVESIDQVMEALTGLPAGERGAEGRFPEGTLNARVEARLQGLAEKARAFGKDGKPGPTP